MSYCNFLTSVILTNREIPLEYNLMMCLSNAFAVFSPFLFSLRCLYSVYVLLTISSLALSTFSCVHLLPNKCNLPLSMRSMRLFKHSHFLCCAVPSLVYQQYHQKSHHRLIYFQRQPLPLLNVEIATI